MNAIVFEHVPVADLPEAWRDRLGHSAGSTVTVRIEQDESAGSSADAFVTDDPAFGIWRDREDMADPSGYVREVREPRYNRDGSRNGS